MTTPESGTLSNLYVERAEVYYSLNEYEKCVEDLNRSISLNGAFNPNVFFLLAISHRNSGNCELALEIINNLISISEEPLPKYYIERGITYFKLEKYDLAIIDLQRGLTQFSNNPEATRLLALSYEKLGDVENTLRYMLHASEQGDIAAGKYLKKMGIFLDSDDYGLFDNQNRSDDKYKLTYAQVYK